MRVAAVYDIHGNLPALEAVIESIRENGADQVIVGGDVVPGPMPGETLACLRGLGIPVHYIQGNGEVAVLAAMAGKEPDDVPKQFQEIVRWTAQQLGPEDEELLASWPKTLAVEVHGLGKVLFCHATPRSKTEIFTQLTPEERLRPIFEGVQEPMVVCGHTHMQFDRMIEGIRVVNAGSVGMPFGEPGAYWLLLGPDVRLQKTDYDFDKAGKRIRRTRYPKAAVFAARNVVQPPSEAEILKVYEKAG
jgi:putative phosphoesterase